MKMLRSLKLLEISVIFFIYTGLFLPFHAYAQTAIDQRTDTLLCEGIEAFNNENIDKAIFIIDEVIDLDEESPVGYFYMAAIYKAMMQDYRTMAYSEKFYFYINKAIEKGEEKIKREKDNATAYFYLGGAYGYRAINKSEEGKWFGAFLDAEKGADNLEKALTIDPELYDAYYGLGVYKYWRSVKSKSLWFLPFFNDEREQGIKEIKLAIERGKYSRIEAKGALITIYRNEKEYDKALGLANEILRDYPEDIYALRSKGIIYVEMKRWNEATLVFNQLSEYLKKRGWKESRGADIEIEYYLTLIENGQRRVSENEYKKGCEKLAQLREKLEKEQKNEILSEFLEQVAFVVEN